MNKKISLGAAVTLIIVAVALTVSVTMIVAMRQFNYQLSNVSQRQAMYDYIDEVDKAVRENDIGSIDEEALDACLAKGYMAGIKDPYAAYLTAAEYATATEHLSGKWTGLGLSILKQTDGSVVIAEVDTNSAAEKAGIAKGDVITQLDGTSVSTLGFDKVKSTLASAAKAKLSVTRGAQSIAFDISSSTYTKVSVESRMIGTTGYIRITGFYENTPEQFEKAYGALETQGAENYIFDLRNNGGGSIDAACKVIGYLLPRGTYANKKDAKGTVTPLSATDTYEMKLPSVTLVNASTSGEAELFAAVLKDFSKTTVVGMTTAGRGMIQKYFTISDGSAVKLSVASLSLTSGTAIEGKGVTPTVVVGLTADEENDLDLLTEKNDPQLIAALTTVKGGAVTNPTTDDTTTPVADTTTAPAGTTAATKTATTVKK